MSETETSTTPSDRKVVGIPREIHPGERRVAATPATVSRIRKLGYHVLVEKGAGDAANAPDAAFQEAGAQIVSREALWAAADVVLKVRPPLEIDGVHEADLLKEGATLIGHVWPAQNEALVRRLAARRATVLAMDAVPRISRAQKLDALSAMANVAGYRAVVEAASRFGRFLGGQTTAAGRVRPAQVLVVGAGVAGLAAIAAARSLGAVVRAFDTRPVVREQVESLGGRFIPFEFKGETGEGEGGYARQVSDAYLAAEQELLAKHCAECDIVITTALVPGKPAPKLITSGAIVGMRRGSVIVDLAAEQGGNTALTERDAVVERFGVTIVGLTDLPSRMAEQASELYAMTVYHLLEEITREGQPAIDESDEVQRAMLVLRDGELKWPPPRPEPVRAGAPTPPPPDRPRPTERPASPWPLRLGVLAACLVLAPLAAWGPPDLLQHVTVFVLACIVGWHVIWNVTPALHTPLMSVTNAISGIILVGGLVLGGGGERWGAVLALAAVAVLVASVNVAGGFLVTQRMLRMFRK
ncbi:MAG: Re/Si-specific NAD(P)(+) transhydrogenase subunit alpha [Myxococcota bacterium]|nr:Re/Si-specific NAD(P)(+) transhydrogenase subunit alpha [Myxococcota bacterium]MDW8360761.1 Re/Si-specific NAD(P)(+) transhydrogenase subunit alpha [Myxococcales bacterium]